MLSNKPFWILLIMADLVFFTAPIVFVLAALTNGMSIGATIDALVDQYSADRTNLLVVSLMALAPMLLLTLIIWIGRRFGKFAHSGGTVALGGSLAILIVTVFVNLEYWPKFLPARTFLGWPHGIEFLLGPAIAAPVAMLIGMVIGMLAARR